MTQLIFNLLNKFAAHLDLEKIYDEHRKEMHSSNESIPYIYAT